MTPANLRAKFAWGDGDIEIILGEYCQVGPNKGKPGPCPEGKPGPGPGADRGKGEPKSGARPSAPGRTFTRKADIADWSQRHYGGWEAGLSPHESSAFTKYVGDEYTQFNGFLRNTVGDVATAAGPRGVAVRTLDAALSRAKVPEDVTAFRGMTVDPGLKAGATFQDKGYVSTSLHQGSAENFAGQGGGVVMEIKVPKGSSGAMVDALSGFDEAELLLPRQSKFKVTGKRQSGGRTFYQLELLNA